MALIKLESDPDWHNIGGRLLNVIHDELLCEVPFEYRDKGAEILSRCMCEAGSFFPFPLTCDVETTFRWYGLGVEDILSFDKPESLDKESLSESNIKWIQCMLYENEYKLPVLKNEDGSKPIGIAAEGINGKWTDDLDEFIASYKKRYGIKEDEDFLNHIEKKVMTGEY